MLFPVFCFLAIAISRAMIKSEKYTQSCLVACLPLLNLGMLGLSELALHRMR